MRNRTQPSFRIHAVLFILIIGFVGTLVALAETGAKVSELKIPPRRQDETEGAYRRRVSIARNAYEARLRFRSQTPNAKVSELKIPPRREGETEDHYQRRVAVADNAYVARTRAFSRAFAQWPLELDKQASETDAAYQTRLCLTIKGLLNLHYPDPIPKRSNETEAASQARAGAARANTMRQNSLIARPGEAGAAYFARLTASKERTSSRSAPKRARETTAAHQARTQVLPAGGSEKQESFGSLDSQVVLTDVDLLTEQERTVVDLPFETSLSTDGVSASRRTYCNGNYGISDIGPLRIAVSDLTFSGKSSSESITVRPSHLSGGGSGSTGTGNRRFTYTKQGDRTLCTFGGIEFSFVDGKMIIGDAAISFENTTTVFLSREGQLQKLFR